MSAKTKGVAHRCGDSGRASGVGNVVEIALGVRVIEVDCGRKGARADGLHAGNELDGSGGAKGVSGHRFCGAYRDFAGVFTEDGFDGEGLTNIALRGGGAVGIDVA